MVLGAGGGGGGGNSGSGNNMIFPERRLMVLMRGVCEGVKALHCYRVGGGRGGDARKVRREGERVDREREGEREERKMKKGGRKKGGGHQGEEGVEMESEPLMEGEVMRSQDGIAEGEVRAYAHRDIKPGEFDILFHLLPVIVTTIEHTGFFPRCSVQRSVN